MTPRFRHNGITILNLAREEIGVLDSKTASGMVALQQAVSSVRFEVYTAQKTKLAHSSGETLGTPLEILVFGQSDSLEEVGSHLSQSGLFLQEPINRPLSVQYKNPHVFSWDEDDDTRSSYLLERSSESEASITDEIQAVLDNTSVPRLSFQIRQDARITSTLKPLVKTFLPIFPLILNF